MKEYRNNKWGKIIAVFLCLPFAVLWGWIVFNVGDPVLLLGGIAFLALFLYTGVNIVVYKLRLDEESIEEKNLFRSKKIFFNKITKIEVESLLAKIRSGRKTIQIGRITDGFEEILTSVFARIKENREIVFYGDPILIKSYVTKVSPPQTLIELAEPGENVPVILQAKLIDKRWLFRVVNVVTDQETFRVAYFGRGMGYECVFVNNDLVSKKNTHWWYAPQFNFNVRGMAVSVNVRVYPWGTIRRFWIEAGDKIVYSEGI